MQVQQYDIIDFFDSRKIVCGLVLEAEDRRLRVLTEQGRETTIPLSRLLTADRAPDFPLHGSRDEQIDCLKQFAAEREAGKKTVNLRELWEVVSPDLSEIDARELTELCFGNAQDMHGMASLLRAIYDDRVYFRIRPDVVEISDAEKVAQTLLQREKEQERATFLARCTDFLATLKEQSEPPPDTVPDGLIPLLVEAVKYREQWLEMKSVREMFSKAGLLPHWNPFRVLVALGVWSPDENVTLRVEDIPTDFSSEAQAAAQDAAQRPLPPDAEDLTDHHLITIDSVYTRDLDDALSVSPEGDGWLLGVHIADASHFIDFDSPFDRETRERATSIYMPDLMIPMLPPTLSEEAASLVAGELRPAVSVLVHITRDLAVAGFRVVHSMVRVRERLSYEEADERIATEGSREAIMFRIACALREARVASGAIIFRDPEISIHVTENGDIDVHIRERESPSQVLVSELMILANRLFARFLREQMVPCIYRSQPPPLEPIELNNGYDPVLSWRAKKVLARSEVGTHPAPHSSLGAEEYTTATSPLRRYTDLTVQRQIKAVLCSRPPLDLADIERIIEQISFRIDRAALMERERHRYFLLKHLEQRRKEEFHAVVLHRFPRFHLAQLTELCINAPLFTPNSITLNPHDSVLVRVEKINPREDKLRLSLVKLL